MHKISFYEGKPSFSTDAFFLLSLQQFNWQSNCTRNRMSKMFPSEFFSNPPAPPPPPDFFFPPFFLYWPLESYCYCVLLQISGKDHKFGGRSKSYIAHPIKWSIVSGIGINLANLFQFITLDCVASNNYCLNHLDVPFYLDPCPLVWWHGKAIPMLSYTWTIFKC